jgi:plastocyanin
MKKILNGFFFFSISLMSTISGIAQTSYEITVTNFTFTPTPLTIATGDTVRWDAVLGHHNVVADDGSFTSGPPADAPWEYVHVFTSAGNNPYYCEPHGGPGGNGMSGVIIVEDAVSVPEEDQFVNKFQLKQNYPNPFNPSTKINFVIPQESFVSIKVFDVIGNEITTLVNEVKQAGEYEVDFFADKQTSGVYVYQLRADNFIQTRKMILLR